MKNSFGGFLCSSGVHKVLLRSMSDLLRPVIVIPLTRPASPPPRALPAWLKPKRSNSIPPIRIVLRHIRMRIIIDLKKEKTMTQFLRKNTLLVWHEAQGWKSSFNSEKTGFCFWAVGKIPQNILERSISTFTKILKQFWAKRQSYDVLFAFDTFKGLQKVYLEVCQT